jgi:hypothetical protein
VNRDVKKLANLIGAFAIGAAAVVLAGCTTETTCDYIDQAPTGDPTVDIPGCWQGIGNGTFLGQDPAFLVVYQFADIQPDGTRPWREIQSPNRIWASGQTFFSAYQIDATDGGTHTVNMGRFEEVAMQVTDTSLRINYLDQNNQPVFGQVLRRAQCTGYGFEDPANACPPPRTP